VHRFLPRYYTINLAINNLQAILPPMRRPICWVDKLEDGIKREVRVTLHGVNKIKWQFKRSDEPTWDYDSPPTQEDLQNLLERAEGRYHRRAMPFEALELIKKACEENKNK